MNEFPPYLGMPPIDNIPQGQKEVWKDLVSAVSGWREEMLTYFETDIPITNAFT